MGWSDARSLVSVGLMSLVACQFGDGVAVTAGQLGLGGTADSAASDGPGPDDGATQGGVDGGAGPGGAGSMTTGGADGASTTDGGEGPLDADADGPGDMGDGPGDMGDGPGDMGDGPGDMGDGPGDMGDGPGDMGEGPGETETGDGLGDTGDTGTDDGDTVTDPPSFPPCVGKGECDDTPLGCNALFQCAPSCAVNECPSVATEAPMFCSPVSALCYITCPSGNSDCPDGMNCYSYNLADGSINLCDWP